jgi:hypothetical protein
VEGREERRCPTLPPGTTEKQPDSARSRARGGTSCPGGRRRQGGARIRSIGPMGGPRTPRHGIVAHTQHDRRLVPPRVGKCILIFLAPVFQPRKPARLIRGQINALPAESRSSWRCWRTAGVGARSTYAALASDGILSRRRCGSALK